MKLFNMMNRNIMYTVITAVLFLVIWIYRISNIETNNAINILKQQNIFIMNPIISPASTTCQSNPFIVIIVTSYVGHVELRSAHRRAMPQEYLKSFNATRIFLLARIPQTEREITQEAIDNESQIFGDILQGPFVENYRNLTYKHLMGLQWASSVCEKATFILKVDDDIVFDFNRTYKYVTSIPISQRESFISGHILNNTFPRRKKQNKWYVTWDEYPRNIYPPYLSGWYYIMSPKIAKEVCKEAIYHPYFWIDDILITGVLTEALGIQLKELPVNYMLEYYELLECCLKDMVAKSIKCDYVVGPNGGRNNLIVEFNQALANCDMWKNCTVRSVASSLKRTCVMYRERTIFSVGQGEVRYIKL